MVMRTCRFSVDGMHCQGCELVIEQAVGRLPGVRKAKADYATGLLVVNIESHRTNPFKIAAAVEEAGYICQAPRKRTTRSRTLLRILAVLLAIASIVGLLAGSSHLAQRFEMPHIETGMSYGLLFLVGLITGLHCVAMCGGFVVGYTTHATAHDGRTPLLPHVLYGFGKTLSYTLIGGTFGLLGAFIALTPQIRGYAAIAAGTFLVLFGINMLDWFPLLRHVGIRMPRFLARFVSTEQRRSHSPFVIGLLNGLMIACGPLQAMYIMAAGTGSFAEGAKMLLVFGVGTLPVMLGFGLLAGVVSGGVTRALLKLSALLVVALGLIMLNRGLVMSGSAYDFRTLATIAAAHMEVYLEKARENVTRLMDAGYQVIHMEVTAAGYSPDRFTLKQGVPVRWIINGKELTTCNHRIVVPSLKLEFDLKPGKNVIEFTPREAGVIPWSCWMGMIPGTFVVEPRGEDGFSSDPPPPPKNDDAGVPERDSGSVW